jgi:hypothetical protein
MKRSGAEGIGLRTSTETPIIDLSLLILFFGSNEFIDQLVVVKPKLVALATQTNPRHARKPL